ncbi:MAG TPA: hypothetical protein VNR39_01430 [Pseudolabrys sp.]|nr:hypothetical protein [Pseudolabrys sp.]
MADTKRVQKMSLKEFHETKGVPAIEAVLGRMNGGTFMECHTKFFEATGIWIPELVPVFQRLDAGLAFKELPSALR